MSSLDFDGLFNGSVRSYDEIGCKRYNMEVALDVCLLVDKVVRSNIHYKLPRRNLAGPCGKG